MIILIHEKQLIVKEKGIFERKNTIKIFKRKKLEDRSKGNLREDKDSLLKSGKIFITEFWSAKY